MRYVRQLTVITVGTSTDARLPIFPCSETCNLAGETLRKEPDEMARIRTVKPEFWSDEKLAECSLEARLLFIGTWNFADDEGRMEYSPKRLKMQVFPGDNIDVASLVEELAKHALVIAYRVEKRDYLAIPNFKKHQRVDHPKPSTIPAPPVADSQNATGTIQERSPNDQGTLAPEGKGREWNGIKTISSNPDGFDGAVKAVFDYYLEKTNRNPKTYEFTPLRKQKGISRLKECGRKTAGDYEKAKTLMKLAVDGLVASDFHMGRESTTSGKKYCEWEKHLFKSYEQMESWWNKLPSAPVKPNGQALEVHA
jgi:hypothetical protein